MDTKEDLSNEDKLKILKDSVLQKLDELYNLSDGIEINLHEDETYDIGNDLKSIRCNLASTLQAMEMYGESHNVEGISIEGKKKKRNKRFKFLKT